MKYLSLFFLLFITSNTYTQSINLYGPGGPHIALSEVAESFKKDTGILVNVNFGPEAKWSQQALKNADILFSASDNQMTAFLQTYKNFSQAHVHPIYLHDALIIVQKGNPKKITGIKSLLKSGYNIIVNDGSGISQTSGTGVWEDILGRTKNINMFAQFKKNIVFYAVNSGSGRDKFLDPNAKIDAWISWSDWGILGEVIPIEKELSISRPLNIAIKNNPTSQITKFIEYLNSDKSQKIFQKHGWYKTK
ncbi:MAG: substrate-binding domain-containing protein [Brevinemataceae bacterium]